MASSTTARAGLTPDRLREWRRHNAVAKAPLAKVRRISARAIRSFPEELVRFVGSGGGSVTRRRALDTEERRRSGRRRRGEGAARQRAAAASPADADGRDVTPLLCALLAVFSFALYANTISHGYALDDSVVITGNDFTRAGFEGIGDLLTSDSFYGALGRDVDYVPGGRYRPLSLVTFAIECQLFGVTPQPSHFLNALLYALCVVVAYLVLATLLRETRPASWRPTLALLTVLLFAAHPLHTEAVANIKGRDEILALLLSLAAMGTCLRAVDTSRPGLLVWAAVAFFAALLAKESAITFLAIVPLSILFFRPDQRGAPVRALVALAVPALLFLVIRQSIVASARAPDELLNNPFLGASLGEHYATVFYTLGLYLKLLVWPHPLTHDYYPYHVPIVSWADWRPWLGLVLHALLGMLAVLGYPRRHVVSYGIAFYLITLSIASNVFVSIGTFMGERFLFTPLLGACLVASWVLLTTAKYGAPRHLRPALAAGLVAVLLVPLAGKTVMRNRVWKDHARLVLTDVETSAGSAKVRVGAADQLVRQALAEKEPTVRARLAERARKHLDAALRIHPRYQLAWFIQAYLYRHLLHDLSQALHAYERVLELNPHARDVSYSLGTLLLEHRPERLDEAVKLLERAVEQAPADPSALRNLGAAYYEKGDKPAAVAHLERAARLRPDDTSLLLDLARIFEETGDSAKHTHYRRRAERLGGVYTPK